MRTYRVDIAILSHLSDVQELILAGQHEAARKEVNFVKLLVMKYPNTRTELAEKEIDDIYKTALQK